MAAEFSAKTYPHHSALHPTVDLPRKMQRRYRVYFVFVAVLLGAVGTLANKDTCPSKQFTTNGECCQQCAPGDGVIVPCGAKQTVCAPCLDSETFSESFSHTEICQPCTQCTDLFRMETPCTDSTDAICVCNYGYYLDRTTQKCQPCTKCPEGQGMLYRCEDDRDTGCENCTGDTYSDQESSWNPCIPCSTCDDEMELKACTPFSDTICQGPDITETSTFEPSAATYEDYTFQDFPPEIPADSSTSITTTTTTNGNSQQRIYQGLNDKLIPIYCSILAAVVVGLVAFIIFKRWNSCKQNKQGANNCTPNQNQTPSPEGEKLHSDSGISVDSQSLQEQQGQSQAQTVVNMDEEPCLLLPLHTREKVEKLLFKGSDGDDCNHMHDSDWSSLATLLGYEEERIATFQQEEHPVCALLSDWARKDCASIEALCTALRKINREDIAQSLVLSPSAAKTTVTSVV